MDNTPYLIASAQAVQFDLVQWIYALLIAANRVSPTTPTAVDVSPCLTIAYVDADRDGRETSGDQIRIDSPSCPLSPLGNGNTLLTTLSTDAGNAIEARVQANGTLDTHSLSTYGWSQRMQGTWRFTLQTDGVSMGLVNEGEIGLTLGDGTVLRLLNVALVFKPPVEGPAELTGQFDLRFDTGTHAGTLVPVDLGVLKSYGANVGPYPGYLQIAGTGGSKAKVRDTFEQGFPFETSLDAAGSGTFTVLSTVQATAFYAPLSQL